MFEKGIFGLYRKQGGQALLIVVLVMVVALTVGLSVASRSITNLKNSQEQMNSQKALSAAEIGLDRVLAGSTDTNLKNPNPIQNDATYSATASAILGSTNFLVDGGNEVAKNDRAYIWTTTYSNTNPWQNPWAGTGGINIYWGQSNINPCSVISPAAALEVVVISGAIANPTLTRYAYDPCTPARTGQNGFTPVAAMGTKKTINNTDFYYSVNISLPQMFLISVSPIYAASYIGAGKAISTDPDLPDQGSNITAVGSVSMADSNVQRVLSAFQGFPQIPAELFPYTIFSP